MDKRSIRQEIRADQAKFADLLCAMSSTKIVDLILLVQVTEHWATLHCLAGTRIVRRNAAITVLRGDTDVRGISVVR